MHQVLGHLRAEGLTSVPAPLTFNDDHETVSLLPGVAGRDCWPHQATEVGLARPRGPHVRALAAAGVQPQVDWVARGHLDELAARVAWSEANRSLFGRFAV